MVGRQEPNIGKLPSLRDYSCNVSVSMGYGKPQNFAATKWCSRLSTIFCSVVIIKDTPHCHTVSQFQAKYDVRSTFKELHEYSQGIWVIVILPHSVFESHCSYPIFLKESFCKHMLGILIRLKLVDVPAEAKNVPLGRKRKRGCPSKAVRALLVQ